MYKKVLLVLAIMLFAGLISFGQKATARGSVYATIIDLDEYLKKYALPADSISMKDKLNLFDSIQTVEQAQITLINPTVKIGMSTTEDVMNIYGNDFYSVPIANPTKQKWVYKDSIVFFTNDVVTVVVPSAKSK